MLLLALDYYANVIFSASVKGCYKLLSTGPKINAYGFLTISETVSFNPHTANAELVQLAKSRLVYYIPSLLCVISRPSEGPS